MRIVFFGTTHYSAAMLRAIADAGHEVCLAVTLPDKPSFRGHRPEPTPLRVEAEALEVPTVLSDDMHDLTLADAVVSARADLGVVVAFKILLREVFTAPKMGTINVHPSLLPDLRGPAPIRWALIYGDERTGVTTFLLDDKPDTGDMLLSCALEIGKDETYGELCPRIEASSAKLLLETIEGLEKGVLKPIKQQGLPVRKAPKIKKEICKIDWSRPAREIHNLVRGLSPFPGAFTVFRGNNVIVLRSRVERETATPGDIIECAPKTGILVACGEGSLRLLELKPASGKPQDCLAFICGRRPSPGEVFG